MSKGSSPTEGKAVAVEIVLARNAEILYILDGTYRVRKSAAEGDLSRAKSRRLCSCIVLSCLFLGSPCRRARSGFSLPRLPSRLCAGLARLRGSEPPTAREARLTAELEGNLQQICSQAAPKACHRSCARPSPT